MYGTQTGNERGQSRQQFENDVKMYGTQTGCMVLDVLSPFENDVKMYGTQTKEEGTKHGVSLRMM